MVADYRGGFFFAIGSGVGLDQPETRGNNRFMIRSNWLAVAGVYGALGIAIGAFGAHGLPAGLESQGYEAEAIVTRLETFETGARYHMYAALALVGVSLAPKASHGFIWSVTAWLLLSGSLLFSGLLYGLAILGPEWRWLGMIVPLGGLLQIGGWVMIAVTAQKSARYSGC